MEPAEGRSLGMAAGGAQCAKRVAGGTDWVGIERTRTIGALVAWVKRAVGWWGRFPAVGGRAPA
jgi:hypothetical protein